MVKKKSAYLAAQEELTEILSSQKTVNVKRLNRLLQTLNISVKPGSKSPYEKENEYLKEKNKDFHKKLSKQGKEIEELRGR